MTKIVICNELLKKVSENQISECLANNYQRRANRIARAAGYGTATSVILFDGEKKDRVLNHVDFGYRKNTTGEYVCNAYLNNFGWKNTHYQAAETTVAIHR